MENRWIIANEADTVAIALVAMELGETVAGIALCEAVPAGHKVAIKPVAKGAPVIKLGHTIGIAIADIAPGAHVHVHNLAFAKQDGKRTDSAPRPHLAPRDAHFMGYKRADGRVGTRNFIGILTSVNCSATVAKRIAAHFTPARLAAFPHVDGVIAFSHMSGCGMAKDGLGLSNLRRTITGYATHPNFAGVLIVGLGCEVNQIDPLLDAADLAPSQTLQTLGIQDSGGTMSAIARGIEQVAAMLPLANKARRERVSAKHLTIGLQCGASDGYSGITANPALGGASDSIVAAGGRVVLSETPEIFGAEDLLLVRAASPDVSKALVERLKWWEDYAANHGADLNNNPSPGNKAGGITTILEKSLGAVAKAGTTALNAVVHYAEPVTAAGLSFMDSPGYDPCSATGQIAGGANLIVFTTGRGSVFGSLPAPTLKLASNAALAQAMADDIDLDCSPVLADVSLEAMGETVFQAILDAASGTRTASEALGLGENEWVPWTPGAMF